MNEIAGASGNRWAARFDGSRLLTVTDALAAAVAVSLPWSTSATSILVVAWLLALLPTLDIAAVRRELWTPAGGVPVLLWLLAVVGLLWAVDVPFKERLAGLGGYHKLLLIPLFILQFRRSERAGWVITGFLASCGVLLAASWLDLLFPIRESAGLHFRGVPVKDHIAQGGEFVVCALFLAPLALHAWQEGRRRQATAAALGAIMFLANVIYIGTSRTALVTIVALLVLFGCKFLNRNARIGLLAALIAAGAVSWPLTGSLRGNIATLIHEMRIYRSEAETTRTGERLEYWRKSIRFISRAPLIGHGTGSIRDQFRRSAEGQSGMAAEVAANPHNQTFAVAIQLGLLGAAVLFAMWAAHLRLFWREGITAWFGLIIVVQNILGSLFNSHLFDFTQGWSYVLGVGVAGGAMAHYARRANAPLGAGNNP